MPSYTVRISAGAELLWSARVDAGNSPEAKLKAIALMQDGGGHRPKIGAPPPGPFNVKVERSKIPAGWTEKIGSPATHLRRHELRVTAALYGVDHIYGEVFPEPCCNQHVAN